MAMEPALHCQVVTKCGACPDRYNKQVLKAFHFPFTCTNLQVSPLPFEHPPRTGGASFCCVKTYSLACAADKCSVAQQHQGCFVSHAALQCYSLAISLC